MVLSPEIEILNQDPGSSIRLGHLQLLPLAFECKLLGLRSSKGPSARERAAGAIHDCFRLGGTIAKRELLVDILVRPFFFRRIRHSQKLAHRESLAKAVP